MLWVVVSGMAWAGTPAGCASPTARHQVLEPVSTIFQAYGALDTETVAAADAALTDALRCLGVPLTPAEVADVHRARALAASAAGDHELAKLRFAASRKLQPSWRFPPEVVPDDPAYPEWERLTAIPLSVSKLGQVPASAEGAMRFDGEPARVVGEVDGQQLVGRETSMPLFFQHIDDDGTPTVSAYVPMNAPLPAYPGSDWRPPVPEAVVITERTSRWTRPDKVIAGVSSAFVVGGGVLTGIGYYNYLAYCSPDSELEEACADDDLWDERIVPLWISGYSLIGAGALGWGWAGLRVKLRPDSTTVSVSGTW